MSDEKIRVLTFDPTDPDKVLAFLDHAKENAKANGYTFCALVMANDTDFETGWCSEERSRVRVLQARGLIMELHDEFVQHERDSLYTP